MFEALPDAKADADVYAILGQVQLSLSLSSRGRVGLSELWSHIVAILRLEIV